MLKNYLKTAYRSLLRNKSYTFINVAGLTLGITVFLIIFQFFLDLKFCRVIQKQIFVAELTSH